MMGDLKSFPDYDLTIKALNMLSEVNFSSFSNVDKPKNEIFIELSKIVNKDTFYYQNKNYVLRINNNTITPKSYEFKLNADIKIETANITITNLETDFKISINNLDLYKINGYQQLFYLSIDDEIEFNDLLCLNNKSVDNITILHLTSEKFYYLNNYTIEETRIQGNAFWALQLMDYFLNINRDTPIQIKIDGTQNLLKRYFFVFPINGIILKTDIRFGMISFSPDSGIDVVKEQALRNILKCDVDGFAQIVIVQKSPKEAINDAFKLLKKTLNLLRMLLLDDSPFLLFNNKNIPNRWDINFVRRTIEIGSYFYVEDVLQENTNAILPCKNERKVNRLMPNEIIIDEINKNNFFEEYFYSSETTEKESILQAIFWLNESFEKLDKKERVISLYNSIEFLVKKEKGISLDEELSKIYDEYNEIKDSLIKITSGIKNPELKKRISGLILKCFEGDTSVKTKFDNLTKRLNIILSENEWKIYDALKDNRHALIHNKKLKNEISNKELDVLYHLISRVIIAKIIYETGERK